MNTANDRQFTIYGTATIRAHFVSYHPEPIKGKYRVTLAVESEAALEAIRDAMTLHVKVAR